MLKSDSMFSLPIYTVEVADWIEKKQKIKKIIDNLYLGVPSNDPNHCLTDFFLNKEPQPYWSEILEILDKEITRSERGLFNKREMMIEGFWVEKSTKSKSHPIHNHGALGYSAVLYVDFDPEHHSPTRFVSPFNDWETGAPVYYLPKVREGVMIYFPSYILHEAPPNLSDKTRTIISFNFKV